MSAPKCKHCNPHTAKESDNHFTIPLGVAVYAAPTLTRTLPHTLTNNITYIMKIRLHLTRGTTSPDVVDGTMLRLGFSDRQYSGTRSNDSLTHSLQPSPNYLQKYSPHNSGNAIPPHLTVFNCSHYTGFCLFTPVSLPLAMKHT